MTRWFILDRDGHPMPESELPKRPEEARPENNDAFRPWFKQESHLHMEGGRISGIHASGTLISVQEQLTGYLKREDDLLRHFGSTKDLLISQADAFLAKVELNK